MILMLLACQEMEKTEIGIDDLEDSAEPQDSSGDTGEDTNDPDSNEPEDAPTSEPTADTPQSENEFGVWLWYIEGTGHTHDSLAQELAANNIYNIFVKVADGGFDCGSWPELCDTSIPETYASYGIQAWAWSYNYPDNVEDQAHALQIAYETGYSGYVMDIEIEFD